MPHALHFLVLALAGWVNHNQEDRIDYLREENRVLRERHRTRRAYVGWIAAATREDTRQRRLRKAMRLLAAGKTLGGPPATRRRLCVLRQIGDELVPGHEQFLLVDDGVAVEDGAALVAGQEHGDPVRLEFPILFMTATLCGPGGVRAVIAEHLLLKQQLLVLHRPRQRAPTPDSE